MKQFGKTEMNLGEVDKDGDGRSPRANRPLELLEFTVDARQVQHNFSESHHSHVFRADDALDARRSHALAAHPNELRSLTY